LALNFAIEGGGIEKLVKCSRNLTFTQVEPTQHKNSHTRLFAKSEPDTTNTPILREECKYLNVICLGTKGILKSWVWCSPGKV